MLYEGYIDLSKPGVSPADIIKCEEKLTKGKMISSIMRHVAEKTNTPMETLYQMIGWPLNKKYGNALDAFKMSITSVPLSHLPLPTLTSPLPSSNPKANIHYRNPDIWAEATFPSDAVKLELQSYISKRLAPQPTKVRADIEVTCFGYDGINGIIEALLEAEKASTKDAVIKVRLVSPPLYVMTSQCLEKNAGLDALWAGIRACEMRIKTFDGGNFAVKMEPKAVTENDDQELQRLMEQRERENQEVSGDEDLSDSDEGIPAPETI